MMHHVGAGVYLKEVFVSWCTKPLLLYYQNHCYHVIKYEDSQYISILYNIDLFSFFFSVIVYVYFSYVQTVTKYRGRRDGDNSS